MTRGDIDPEDMFEGLDAYGKRVALPWAPQPQNIDPAPDITVRFQSEGAAVCEFSELQQAVDYAVVLGANPNGPRVIDIGHGFFEGPVIIPPNAPPLVLRGAGAEACIVAAPIDAQMTGLEYAERFKATIACAGASTKAAFAQITARSHIGTQNTAVLRVLRDDVQISGLTIRNDYACDRASAAPKGDVPDATGRFARGQHQAVALMLDQVDRICISACALSSFQDTLYLRSAPDRHARAYFEGCHIEGDVDFIFGGATAFFHGCTIRTRGERGAKSWALAPSTSLHQARGFVLNNCAFTHDGAEAGQNGQSFLGRQWFEGVRATPYGTPMIEGYSCELSDTNRYDPPRGTISRQTLEAVGKALLINPEFGPHLTPDHLWDDWAAGLWSPRFRPVQNGGADLLHLLRTWSSRPTCWNEPRIAEQTWLCSIGLQRRYGPGSDQNHTCE